MFGTTEMLILVAVLLTLVFTGVHIAVSLGAAAMLGIYLMTRDLGVVANFLAAPPTKPYAIMFSPSFRCSSLMGEFLSKCGAATDMFTLINRATKLCLAVWP